MTENQEPNDDTTRAEGQAPKSNSPTKVQEGTQRQEADQESHVNQPPANQNPGPPSMIFWRGTFAGWVTLLFTGVIAVVGCLQLCVYRQQKVIMQRSAEIQAQDLRFRYGSPYVTLTPWLGAYDINGQVSATVNVYNSGKTPAKFIQAAVKVDLLDSEPTDYDFSDKDFQPAYPQTLPAFEPQTIPYDPNVPHPAKKVAEYASSKVTMPTIIPLAQGSSYANKKIYVWGEVRFKDFTQYPDSFKFCRVGPAKAFFDNGNLIVSTDCAIKAARHQ